MLNPTFMPNYYLTHDPHALTIETATPGPSCGVFCKPKCQHLFPSAYVYRQGTLICNL